MTRAVLGALLCAVVLGTGAGAGVVAAPAAGQLPAPAPVQLGTTTTESRATTGVATATVHLSKAAYLAKARKDMKAYCPKTPIRVGTSDVSPVPYGVVGMAYGSWGWSNGRAYLRTEIHLSPGMPAAMLRFVALHECGHVIQYRSMVKGRYSSEMASAAKLWPGLREEGQADCMAYQVTKDPRWFSYVRGCSTKQLSNAARMWKTYGKKYQAAVYRWKL
jgi:hypothetical protein